MLSFMERPAFHFDCVMKFYFYFSPKLSGIRGGEAAAHMLKSLFCTVGNFTASLSGSPKIYSAALPPSAPSVVSVFLINQ